VGENDGEIVSVWAAGGGHTAIVKFHRKGGNRLCSYHQRKIAVALALLIPLTGWAADIDKDLRKAAEKGDVAKVHELLAKGADVNAKDENGVTALMIGAEKGHAEIVQGLLEAGADVKAQDNHGATAAMLAEKNGYTDVAKLLSTYTRPTDADTVHAAPCESKQIKPDKEKGEQTRFFAASLERAKEIMTDAMLGVGFVIEKDMGDRWEARRKHPELGGGGGTVGHEKLFVRFEEANQSGLNEIRVLAQSEKSGAGSKLWTGAVLDQADCIFTALSRLTDKEMAAADSVKPDSGENQPGQEIALRDASPVRLRLRRYLLSKNAHIGDRIAFEVSEDVVVDGRVVIKKGAIGWGKVTKAQQTKGFGRNAQLDFTIDSAKAVNGQNVSLRSNRDALGGTNVAKTALGVGVLTAVRGPLGLAEAAFAKGKQVGVRAGTEFVTFVDGDQTLKLSAGAPQK
jgi:hypothetical protein